MQAFQKHNRNLSLRISQKVKRGNPAAGTALNKLQPTLRDNHATAKAIARQDYLLFLAFLYSRKI